MIDIEGAPGAEVGQEAVVTAEVEAVAEADTNLSS